GKVHIRLLADVLLGVLLFTSMRALVPSRGADGLALAYLAAYTGTSIFLAAYLRAWRYSNA
ncbi:MAG: hypothetical protein ACHQ5A_15435, partial [Opitutales bacterium]